MIKEFQRLPLFGKPTFEKAILKPPFRIIGDFPDEACFIYIVRGDTILYGPQEKVATKSGEGIVMQCGTYLNEYVKEEGVEHAEAIAVHLYPDVLRMLYDKELPGFLDEVENVEPIPFRQYQATQLMATYVESLQFYFDNPSLVSDELLKLKLKELVLLLARTDQADAIKLLIRGLFNRRELDLREVVENNIFNPLSVEELAAICHLSLSSFKRQFAAHYDCPPARYIRRRRLEKAASLLRSTEMRISDVAYDCCFQDLAHFSKTFLREYGAAPSQYREEHRDGRS